MPLGTILVTAAVTLVVVLLVGGGLVWFLAKRMGVQISSAHQAAQQALEEARKEAETIRKEAEIEAKELIFQRTKQAEKEAQRRRAELDRIENRLRNKERILDQKIESFERREKALADKEQTLQAKLESIEKREAQLEEMENALRRKAEEISGLSAEEAKRYLLESLENEVKQEAAAIIRRVENETKEIAERKARQIITLAIQRCATEQVTESTCSVLTLPSDELKGRIIGREGRNIRALEAATGVNLIVDDTPEAVVISSFDPLRREIARLALEKLIADGRIHPARIEEVVKKTERELLEHIRQEGEQVAFTLGIGDLHPELLKLLGRLKFRTSYGQNILMHSQEVAILCGSMAAELGADIQLAKRAGLLHDIGKAVSHEIEGTHALIGADLCRKYGESAPVVHAIAAHHNEEEPRTIVAVLVQAADAISASRPGARRESLEAYIKRLEKLEEIASSFPGVEKSYALQAGREIRIMVEPEKISDNDAAVLAREVTKRIENEVQYPGQIKVTVLRETRVVEYAK
ncbi:MAG: ribonuclease Y [Candidatus Hydrogenedentota bacterium]|uniref:Ribonuclease Y n=1 Tax=Sumerlaea chitinivorans TaxID=2250252 RepID=A0A2Z4YAJ8_SUMC1|nr:Hydrolase (HAD superfamily) [Candidatus Sumerlaea chitinivorans]RMH25037.1 MAG: ribonuclease Y [Candidatus Hydrogenedentota bacterium]GIX44719.1 MAG: ribonuclease Y [Candidatus Sumerlaea sp.]